MIPAVRSLLELAALTVAYWGVDVLARRDGIVHGLRRVGLTRIDGAVLVTSVLLAGLAVVWPWADAPALARWVAVALLAALAWKAATKDVDPVAGEGHDGPRWVLLASVAIAVASPAGVLIGVLLLSRPFGMWQHHATLPMRLLQAIAAHAIVATGARVAGLAVGPAGLAWFLVVMLVSHYFITALAKGFLGPRWYSWATENKLHHLAASAYSWGWARFIPWERWRRFIGLLQGVEKPMQFAAFAVELLAPLALLDRWGAVAFALAWAGFHGGVFVVSGLLFWEWMVADVAVAVGLALLPSAAAEAAFGVVPMVASVLFMGAFPLRHKLWKPMPLGWFDTPLTQRIHWIVETASGGRYGLYNDFMCPHERIYGKVHGCFLAPVPVVTYHLGEVWKHELRDAIRVAGPDLEQLQKVRERFGITPRNRAMTTHHATYLKHFFRALNGGARKHVLPAGLRWLKAPGGQIFHWGELPAYRGQEPVVRVRLVYREEYFDGEQLVRLRDDEVLDVAIDDGELPAPVREITPKELDDYLLGLARGRLIELPGFSGGYVKADDGRA